MHDRNPILDRRGLLAAALFLLTPLLAAQTTSAPAPPPPPPSTAELLDEFVSHVRAAPGFDDSARRFIEAERSRRGDDPDAGDLLAESLALLYPDFRAALDAVEAADASRALDLLHPLARDADPYLAVNAAFFAARLLVENERLIEADELLRQTAERIADWPRRTAAAGELSFLFGFCALENLRYEQAAATLENFLSNFPAAPERMRRSAEQMLAELRLREPQRLGDVHDLMRFAGRELSHGRTDEPVRIRQKGAVELLDRLIQEAEERENSQNSGDGSSGSGSGGGARGLRPGQTPAQRSTLPPGAAGEPGELRDARRARPGDAWGAMPAREREALLQTLQRQFPSQYRELVEQYYRELSREASDRR